MSNENYPVFQTAKLLRVLIPSREGKKGEYAVGLCEHDGHEYTILFCSETFPLDILNKIIGKIIRVDPTNGRGLRAVDFKNQEFEIVKENLESTAQEVQKLHVKQDNSENVVQTVIIKLVFIGHLCFICFRVFCKYREVANFWDAKIISLAD